jgi:UDP-N-acetylmuramoyl-L-alanyl-D-glutamate--2,6-diaminopimelate ligase
MGMSLEKIERMISLSQAVIRDDSRKVEDGDIFVATRGVFQDAHVYIREAVLKGAAAVVCEDNDLLQDERYSGKIVIVPDSRKALGDLAKLQFKDPSRELMIYGVTGTNGKSTTVSMIEGVFRFMGLPCGMTGTVFNKIRGDILEKAEMTTPGLMKLNCMLREMADNGKKAAAVEMSSHALQQGRVYGIELEGAVFTNITSEHMDYHGDMEAYLKAKSKIFDLLRRGGAAAVNADDDMVMRTAKGLCKADVITFGSDPKSGVSFRDVYFGPEGTEFDILFYGKKIERVKSPFPGKHNIMNMLGAAAVLLKKGFPQQDIIKGLEHSAALPGRLEKIDSSAPFRVFVDYAHTPDALRSVVESLKAATTGRLLCVFGCGGDRDTGKRPVMGAIAGEFCDSIVLTDDNPRTEDPQKILREIERGIPQGAEYSIMHDRQIAINKAISEAGRGDTVLIAGKGHENYQIFAQRTVHFDDREAAVSALKKTGYRAA